MEDKILEIINKVNELYGNKRYELPHVRHKIMAKEIAAMIEPYQKLIEAQDELINVFSFRMSFIDTDEREDELIKKVTELRKEIKK